jgi:hypothetical protein
MTVVVCLQQDVALTGRCQVAPCILMCITFYAVANCCCLLVAIWERPVAAHRVLNMRSPFPVTRTCSSVCVRGTGRQAKSQAGREAGQEALPAGAGFNPESFSWQHATCWCCSMQEGAACQHSIGLCILLADGAVSTDRTSLRMDTPCCWTTIL